MARAKAFRRGVTVALALVFAALGVACPPATPPGPPPPPPKTARTVSAIVLVNHCASLGSANGKLAEKAMNQLVEGCGAYTGGSARFTATLLPGGAIQFAARDDASDTIPICVVSRPLKHSVRLAKSCALDIELEALSMVVPGPPHASDAGK